MVVLVVDSVVLVVAVVFSVSLMFQKSSVLLLNCSFIFSRTNLSRLYEHP